VIYEDVNVKIGCIRKVTPSQSGFQCAFKIFMRNHNQQQLTITALQMEFTCPGFDSAISLSRSSQPLPLASPLLPNATIDLDLDISWSLVNLLPLGIFTLVLSYELSNLRKSGSLPITLPLNIMHFLTPHVQQSFEFKGLWEQINQK
jgi:hypothetical protein